MLFLFEPPVKSRNLNYKQVVNLTLPRLTGRDKDDIKKKEFRRIYWKGWRHTVGKWNKFMGHIGTYPAALGKWLAVGGFIGGIGGVIGSLFHIGVNYATQTRGQHPWILYLLPALGLIIAGLYRVTKVEGKDTNTLKIGRASCRERV